MDAYLAEIEVIEWFRMTRARSERATVLARARAGGEVESAQQARTALRESLERIADRDGTPELLAPDPSAEHAPV